MAYIPAAMNGNKIQHDIQFSNDGPITGIVGALQAPAALGAGTTTLILGGTAGASEIVMSSDFLAIDPAGNKTLKLPNVLGDLTLVGRTIKIFNSADAVGELITLQDFANNFICYVGFGAVVEFYISSHDSSDGSVEVVMFTETFKHSVSGDNDNDVDIVPEVAGKAFIPLRASIVSAGTPNANGSIIQVEDGTDIDFITFPDTALVADTKEIITAESPAGYSPVGAGSNVGKLFKKAATTGDAVTTIECFFVQI